MSTATGVGALLLAAGAGRRYGGPKQLAKIDGLSLLRRAALACIEAGCGLRVVLGAHADDLAGELSGLELRTVLNPAWQAGMGSSIACGVRDWLHHGPAPAALLIVLVDQPRVGAAQLRRLIDAHHQTPERLLVADYGGTRGPPCLFPPSCYAELSGLSGASGAKPVLQAHPELISALAMPEAGFDIDTPDDYRRLAGLPG